MRSILRINKVDFAGRKEDSVPLVVLTCTTYCAVRTEARCAALAGEGQVRYGEVLLVSQRHAHGSVLGCVDID